MPKTAPSPMRIFTMVTFALSCFGLLLFLWLSFGGPIPLKPQGYRVQVAFPEAATLAEEADVRISGVSVGKVRKKELLDGENKTVVEIELESRFAPLASDARAMLRQKTLLGETYVEITPGTRDAPKLPEGGRLADGRVRETVELDEIFTLFDNDTRTAFRAWQQDLAVAVRDRGEDLNDVLGNLPEFAVEAEDVLETLDRQEQAVQRLVSNTAVVFGALTENEDQLRNLILNSADVFEAIASQNDQFAETFRIFPTFLRESRATLARLETFSRDTRPLISDLRPVARDLRPTLADVKALAPDLERFFVNLGPLTSASNRGLPATREILRELQPVLADLTPWLQELNPILQWLEVSQSQVSDFISYGAAAQAETTVSPSGGTGHYLRQFGPAGSESLAIYRNRLPTNRGNAYFSPTELADRGLVDFLITPQFDCRNAGGERKPTADTPGCYLDDGVGFQSRLQPRFPHVERENYSSRGKQKTPAREDR